MSVVRLFCNRPGVAWDRAALYADMESAHEFLCVASGWLSDVEVLKRIEQSDARRVLVIGNHADLDRPEAAWVMARLDAWANTRVARVLLVLGTAEGSSEAPGLMHHKFVLVDNRVTWIGSMNFTKNAARNYESMIAISGAGITMALTAEALHMLESAGVSDQLVASMTPRWMYGRESDLESLGVVMRGVPA